MSNYDTYLKIKMRRIKLIWDFGGVDATKTAEHHVIHLKDFAVKEQLANTMADIEVINEFNTIAYLVVDEEVVFQVRDALIPQRAEIFEG